MKVSFDFDGTLTKQAIERYAKKLVSSGIEVHITTSRCAAGYGVIYDNSDLFSVAERCGIKKENICFTQANWKTGYLSKEFIFHADDDQMELDRIVHIPTVNVKNKYPIKACEVYLKRAHDARESEIIGANVI